MNIFGEGFPKEIVSQVEQRQKVYGSGYATGTSRTNEELVYLNANTSWCRLISGTNINDVNLLNNPTIKNIGLTGADLAKKFILFNGTVDYNPNSFREGITNQPNSSTSPSSLLGVNSIGQTDNAAYGIGGTDFGINPMMGIVNATVNHENRGSLRRATIKIKAFNKAQFEIIDVLYLRLGFNVLLEWGHSMHYDDNGTLNTGNQDLNTLSYRFLAGSDSYTNMLAMIAAKRLETFGNYDAMFGKVTNFHWSFLPDGSYDITVDLASVGDIIESLKVNTMIDVGIDGGNSSTTDTNNSSKSSTALITKYANKSTIGKFLYFLKLNIDEYSKNTPAIDGRGVSISISNPKFTQIKSYNATQVNPSSNSQTALKFDAATGYFFTAFILNANSTTIKNIFPTFNLDKIEFGYRDVALLTWNNENDEYYIRLGTFLQFLEDNIIPKVSDNNGGFVPIIKFDSSTPDNIMYVDPLQVSINPQTCMVRRSINSFTSKLSDPLPFAFPCEDFMSSNLKKLLPDSDYGQIMNIYVNFRHIIDTIDNKKDAKTGKLSLIDFLKGMLDGINEALGGINDFDVFLEETTNKIKIIDKNPLPHKEEILEYFKQNDPTISTELVQFDLYGYSNSNAGFIKDFSFETELTPEFSTMITVGAAVNGSIVGENATALSKINKGLTDRFKTEIHDGNYIEKYNDTLNNKKALADAIKANKTEYDQLKETYAKVYTDYISFLQELSWAGPEGQILNKNHIDTNKNMLSNFYNIENQYKNNVAENYYLMHVDPATYNANTIPPPVPQSMAVGTGFIPFNLSLTMDGLSGTKINQKFTVDTSYLPSNYPSTVEFLIKNMSHEISNNKWYTKLDSYCIALGPYAGSANANVNPNGQNTSTSPDVPLEFLASMETSTNGKWATELRKVIAQLGYTEKYNTQLDSGGDITENMYNIASTILQKLKIQFPKMLITINAGNDGYHQRNSPSSKHADGNAIDIGISNPQDSANVSSYISNLFLGPVKIKPYIINEYLNPSPKSTGGHIHIQI
jgi:hypothetical protein